MAGCVSEDVMNKELSLRELLLSDVSLWTMRNGAGIHRNEFLRALANHECAERILKRTLPLVLSELICGRLSVQQGLVQAGFLTVQLEGASVTGDGRGLNCTSGVKADVNESFVLKLAVRFNVQPARGPYLLPRAVFVRSQRIEQGACKENDEIRSEPKRGVIRFIDYADAFASIRAVQQSTKATLTTGLIDAVLTEHVRVRGWKVPFQVSALRLNMEKAELLTCRGATASKKKQWMLSELCEQLLTRQPTPPSLNAEILDLLSGRLKKHCEPL